jgi:hypothetical protein
LHGLPGLQRRAQHPGVGADRQGVAVFAEAAGQGDEAAGSVSLGKGLGAPGRITAGLVGQDPDLEDPRGLVLEIIFRVPDSPTRAHHLHVPRLGPALVAQTVLMGDGAFADIGDDFHVRMRMRGKAGARRDGVIVPNAQPAPLVASRVAIVGEGKMVLGLQPAMVRAAQAGEAPAFDHVQISVSVTAGAAWTPRWRPARRDQIEMIKIGII